jgi:hypothetical protein
MKKLKKTLKNLVNRRSRKRRETIDSSIPKAELKEKNFINLRVLKDRDQLLKLMPKNGIVAELGVDKGVFSKRILELCEPQKLHLIDVWDSERYHKGLKLEIEEIFQRQIFNKRVEINFGYSTEVSSIFPNEYFDWIYIDTDHSYQLTKLELEMYSSKIKPGGIIAGHDFKMGNWVNQIRYGVIEAVYEFCVANDWEIIFITMNLSENQSFAIRKIPS